MSGADLIGKVPPHWNAKPLRLIGRFLKGTGGSKEDVVESGVPCVRYGDLYTTHNNFIERPRTYLTADRAQDYTRIEYGDVLFAASGETIEEIGKSAVNLLHDARCGGDVVIFRSNQPNIARFFGYAMDAAPVAAQKSLAGRGTTVKHIYPDELREVMIAVPPVGEQQAIADYLDRETARLDALVAAKKRVLRLLAEKRRALITRAVTRGLDPRAPLRDSGIPWLGEIPAHWETKRAKWLFSERDDRSTLGEETLLSLRMERGLVPHNEVSEKQSRPEELVGYKKTSEGEIVVNRMRAAIGLIAVTPQAGVVSPDYAVFIPSNGADVSYYVNLFTTELLGAVFRSVSTGMGTGSSGFLRLYSESFQELWLPHPTLAEQRRIEAFIARETRNAKGQCDERCH